MHDVFSNWYRRAILYALTERDEPMTIAELTTKLVAWKLGSDGTMPAEMDIPERVRTWVRCTHVAELDRFGALVYDPEADSVSLSDDVSLSIEPPWISREMTEKDTIGSLDELHQLIQSEAAAEAVMAEEPTPSQ